MGYLTPLQFILWIAALELVTAPVLILLFSGFCTAYYKAKDIHIARICQSLAKVIDAAGKEKTNVGQKQD